MKIFSKKNSIVKSEKSRSSVRPQIHNSVNVEKVVKKRKAELLPKPKTIKKEAGRETKSLKKKTEIKPRSSFSGALSKFFTKKKTLSASDTLKSTPASSLQKNTSVIQPAPQIEMNVRAKRSRSRLRLVLPLAFPVGALLVMPWVHGIFPRGEITKLYPTVCLGGWENPKNAEGAPSLKSNSHSDLFNDRNSAVLRNSLAQIFCGNFDNTFPEEAFPKKLLLKFSWTAISPSVSRTLEVPAVLAAPNGNASLSVAEEHISTTSPEAAPSSSGSEGMVMGAPISHDEKIPSAIKKDSKPSSSTSTPISFFEKFIRVAFAESASNTPMIEPTDGIVLSPEEASALLAQEEAVASSTTETPKIIGEDFLQVLYTLDGQNWKQLGTVTRGNLADLSFQVPVSDPETLSRFQVSIQNVISVDDPPVIYLDGMWLEAGE